MQNYNISPLFLPRDPEAERVSGRWKRIGTKKCLWKRIGTKKCFRDGGRKRGGVRRKRGLRNREKERVRERVRRGGTGLLLSSGRATAFFPESSFFASRFETGHLFEEECCCYEKEYDCFEKNAIPFTTVVFLWESVFSLAPKARPEGKKGSSAVVE